MIAMFSGNVFKALKLKCFKVPGIDLPDNIPLQFVEGEYMKAEEYDEFLSNPRRLRDQKVSPAGFRDSGIL